MNYPYQSQAEFGEEWDTVLSEGRAVNAMEACAKFGCDASGLNDAWGKAKVTKFGGVSSINFIATMLSKLTTIYFIIFRDFTVDL